MWLSTTAITGISLLALQFTPIAQARPANLPDKGGDGVVADEYIVVLKDLTDSGFAKHISWAFDLGSRSRGGGPSLIEAYTTSNLRVYHGSFDRKTVEKIAINPEVTICSHQVRLEVWIAKKNPDFPIIGAVHRA